MDHVAILNENILLEKIISGEKSIESRWYMNRVQPWSNIHKGDTVYFKLSGKPVRAKATVQKVLQFELDYQKVSSILYKYGKKIGLDMGDAVDLENKKYCILVFLQNPEAIKHFNIDKTGFGCSAAWLYVKNINNVKI
ncbi:hypothetical protein JW756_04840 [Candidatus Woesearchaeota archaeon]|nr:hypothetical protein [Candidatus Woesearchaeota archaeon]